MKKTCWGEIKQKKVGAKTLTSSVAGSSYCGSIVFSELGSSLNLKDNNTYK